MRKRMAAFGAASILFASLFLIPAVRVHAAASFTSLVDVWLQNSRIDSTPIGLTIQSTAQFTSLSSTSGAVNAVIGNVTPNVATFTTVTGTTFTGALSGNATTATALAATPSQCAGGTVETGSAANGNANCTAKGAVTGTQVLLPNQTVCTPATSTDAQCTGSITFSSLGDTAYTIETTVIDSSGAALFMSVTAKSSTGFNYVLNCTFNCSTYTGPTADIRIFHP